MVILSDKDILNAIKTKRILIKPFKKSNVSAASIDLRLSNVFRVFKHSELKFVDPRKKVKQSLTELIKIKKGHSFIIHPQEFVLGSTLEYIKLSSDITARLDGKSSLGRLGLIIHSTAGSIDPGFEGTLTLEITNISRLPIVLYPGMLVCRLTFEELSSKALKPYNKKSHAKYFKQKGPKIWTKAFFEF